MGVPGNPFGEPWLGMVPGNPQGVLGGLLWEGSWEPIGGTLEVLQTLCGELGDTLTRGSVGRILEVSLEPCKTTLLQLQDL